MFSCKSGQEEKTSGAPVAAASVTSGTPVEAAAVSHIMLSDAQLQLANISTAVARTGTIGQELSLTAVLKVNEQSAATVSSRVPGRIEKLYYRNTGETVRKGDKLYEFFSEELVTLQREYMRLESNNYNFSARYEPSLAVREKLQRMGMTELQIQQLAADSKLLFTLPIYSPVSGKIRSVNVSEGEYVEDGQILFELADDINLWVEALAYPYDTRFIRPGMHAEVLIPSAGQAPIKCKIDFINPSFENGKNISLVRVIINNPGRTLHPGMLAILKVRAETGHGVVIPASAVMRDNDGERVWVREACGGFSVRPVISGMQAGDSILIVSGVKESEIVASSGVYLLDSERILKQGPGIPGETELVKTTVAGLN
ncbi:MAG: efflux RND transporter periplasmic adaptor subunit [Bacteroidales bacterium]|nr:efflux RND transporter periplasmic adaptor subunit [Bacteroidales bacterium]